MYRSSRVVLLSLAAAFALTACGSSSPSSSGPAPSTPVAGTNTLAVGSTSVGRIVVNGQGMSVYTYDLDHKGATTSACTGGCAAAWPAVLVTGTPHLAGVSGTVGTIPAPGGKMQVTLNGWPLYTYAEDSAPGQVKGQGVGGTWWAVNPNGTKVTATGSSGSGSGGSGW